MTLIAPFPYFGGKRSVTADVWARLGDPKQYIEPFCGSAAMLLAKRKPASLEVIGDANGFIANFWRATKHQPGEVAHAADYPVSHVDQGARHGWLMAQRERLGAALQDPDWPGDAKVAGWWLWGQCSWIGSGWCEWAKPSAVPAAGQVPQCGDAGMGIQAAGQIPHVSSAGMGIQAAGQIPHVGNAGIGIQAVGKVPQYSDTGMGIQAAGQIPHVGNAGRGIQAAGKIPNCIAGGIHSLGLPVEATKRSDLLTSAGRAAWDWLHKLAARLERVRVVHGEWSRCLNNHYGGDNTAVFLDPPYRAYEGLYGAKTPVADEVCAWAGEHPHLRIALCGHVDDYDLPGWDAVRWERTRSTYSGTDTKDLECIWYSPACIRANAPVQETLL